MSSAYPTCFDFKSSAYKIPLGNLTFAYGLIVLKVGLGLGMWLSDLTL